MAERKGPVESMVTANLDFYKGKHIFITGHTGFKGTWLTKILVDAGAIVTGYSLIPPTTPNLFNLSGVQSKITSIIGDIRDLQSLEAVFNTASPEIVFHLAAQPLVRESYQQPAYTYETNVMGTVNILECIRKSNCVRSFLNITTDKVYENKEWAWGYRENEPLDGFDPYSNSKSCSELVTHCYQKSFFQEKSVAISTARAGNVIGGGDFATDRIIPDCVRAAISGTEIIIRNPNSVRPYQHVLEPLFAYLLIAQKQYENRLFSGWYNVGPNESDCITTGKLVTLFCKEWGNLHWHAQSDNGPHEANFLKLDCSKIKQQLSWNPRWTINEAIKENIAWTKVYLSKGDIAREMQREINLFIGR